MITDQQHCYKQSFANTTSTNCKAMFCTLTHTEHDRAYNRWYVVSKQLVDEQWKEVTVKMAVKNL